MVSLEKDTFLLKLKSYNCYMGFVIFFLFNPPRAESDLCWTSQTKKQANCLPGSSKGYLKELEASRVGGSGTQKSGRFRNVLAGGVSRDWEEGQSGKSLPLTPQSWDSVWLWLSVHKSQIKSRLWGRCCLIAAPWRIFTFGKVIHGQTKPSSDHQSHFQMRLDQRGKTKMVTADAHTSAWFMR